MRHDWQSKKIGNSAFKHYTVTQYSKLDTMLYLSYGSTVINL